MKFGINLPSLFFQIFEIFREAGVIEDVKETTRLIYRKFHVTNGKVNHELRVQI